MFGLGVQGEIPADLRGTMLRNGPGNFEFGEDRMCHPFDGDGLICSFAFSDEGVLARRKFVRTAHMQEEMAAGPFPLYFWFLRIKQSALPHHSGRLRSVSALRPNIQTCTEPCVHSLQEHTKLQFSNLRYAMCTSARAPANCNAAHSCT